MAGADGDPARPARGRRGRPGGDGSAPSGRARRKTPSEKTAGGSSTRELAASDANPAPGADIVCFPCRGTGKVISALGGTPKPVTCPWCEGTGRPIPDHDAQAGRGAPPDGRPGVTAAAPED